jgi:hypothetical protein
MSRIHETVQLQQDDNDRRLVHQISSQVVVSPARLLASSRVKITAGSPGMAASPGPATAPGTNLSPQSPTQPMITFGAKSISGVRVADIEFYQ